MNGQKLSSKQRYEESLRTMTSPVFASKLPEVKMDLASFPCFISHLSSRWSGDDLKE